MELSSVTGSMWDGIRADKHVHTIERLLKLEPDIDWQGFFENIYIRSHKITGIIRYCKGIDSIRRYIDPTNTELRILSTIIADAKREVEDERKLGNKGMPRGESILNKWIKYLDVKGLKPRSIQGHIEGVFGLYRHYKIDTAEFKLHKPKPMEIEDEIPRHDELKRLVLAASPSLKTAILMTKSSGMRIGELAGLRLKDIYIGESPIRIKIRGEVTKTGEPRECFIDDEAGNALKAFIVQKELKFDDYIFTKSLNIAGVRARIRRSYWLLLKRVGLDSKIEGHSYYKFHWHTLRKWFFTNGLKGAQEITVRALIGHGVYLRQYLRKPLEDRQLDYRGIMPHIALFSSMDPVEQRKRGIMDTARMLPGVSPEKLRQLEELLTKTYDLEKLDWGELKMQLLGPDQWETLKVDRDDSTSFEAALKAGFAPVADFNGHTYLRRLKP